MSWGCSEENACHLNEVYNQLWLGSCFKERTRGSDVLTKEIARLVSIYVSRSLPGCLAQCQVHIAQSLEKLD